jgi:hypothetical protein
MRAPQPAAAPQGAPSLRGLEDIVALAMANHASILRVQIENNRARLRLIVSELVPDDKRLRDKDSTKGAA